MSTRRFNQIYTCIKKQIDLKSKYLQKRDEVFYQRKIWSAEGTPGRESDRERKRERLEKRNSLEK